MKLLVKFEGDWEDEITIYGFHVMTYVQWEYKKLELKHTRFPQEVYFGTNDFEVYEDYEVFLRNFKVIEISDSSAEIINRLFGSYYGRFPVIEGNAPKEFYEDFGHYPK